MQEVRERVFKKRESNDCVVNIDNWLYMVIAYQVKWCDTPFVPCLPDIAIRSLHFACQSPMAPLPLKYLIFKSVLYLF